MNISALDSAVVTLDGDISAADLDRLRTALVTAVDTVASDGDLVVDAHGVTAFDDACLTAFVAARSRAKWNRRSLAVLAGVGSPLEASLRRSGHLARIAVHDDAPSARAVFETERARRRAGWDLTATTKAATA